MIKMLAGLVVLVALLLLLWVFFPPAALSSADYKNISYEINGSLIRLVDGTSDLPAAPGSASHIVTRYFGNEAKGDVNGDGIPDIAFLMTQEGGGSGTFYYVVAALQHADNSYSGTNGILLGDRIAPQTTEIRGGTIIVNYADRAPGEPMSAAPSIGVSKYFRVSAAGSLEPAAAPTN